MRNPHSKKVSKPRREYNKFVVSEMTEDYALRYVPPSYRKWSEFLVANTAIGGISFLALEAIGASIAINYGFTNAFWAILVVGLIIFITNLPIAYYSAKYNLDIDLLTRGAGFGYIGSSITSLIYASFTFIFFALEAAIMAQALELYFNLPLAIGYTICSLIIIPLVFFGITFINRLQIWTQPLWILLMVAPFAFIYHKAPETFTQLQFFAGQSPSGAAFDPLLFGAAASVSFALIVQIGEQVDYLRFLPDKEKHNRGKWWLAMLVAGPGWIILGVAKQLGGMLLAFLAITHGLSMVDAVEPVHLYLIGFDYVFSNSAVVLAVTTLFVVISQIKINVTNAYAGSLAWSNFFSRLTHRHPGRVVWLVFNIIIALLLMQLGVFAVLEKILGLYANVAVAWIGAVFADLAINKPLGLSPSYIEYKRGHLYNINPVGTGAMLIASVVSIIAFLGMFGPMAQAFSPFIALVLAIVLVPAIALLTRSRYYIARQDNSQPAEKCIICEQQYVTQDNLYCPVYGGTICSLCCTLDARCDDGCKEKNTIFQWITSKRQPIIGRFLYLFLFSAGLIGAIFILVFYQQSIATSLSNEAFDHLKEIFFLIYTLVLIFLGMVIWWFVLTEKSHQLAQDEVDAQNDQLQKEITERQLAQHRLSKEKYILELITTGKTLSTILDSITHEAEAESPNWLCSILLVTADGKHLEIGSAPNLPGFYNAAVDGLDIGAGIGSCGNAAYTGKCTIVGNIQTHPYCADLAQLAEKAELRSCVSNPILSSKGKVLGTFAIYHRRPITPTQEEVDIITSFSHLASIAIEQKAAEKNEQLATQLIWKQANYDNLTDLPNRRMFQDRLEQEIKKAHRTQLKMALMFIDLDKFKEVNDSFGHDAGDALLIEVAQRVRRCVRESDTVARLGGDEFTVILSELDEINKVERIAQAIINILAAPFKLGENNSFISASIGITIFPDDAKTSEVLMVNADHAMYTTKKMGGNRFSYFTAELQQASQNRSQLISWLRKALPAKQFILEYQPIIELSSGRIHKAEALIRWKHPEQGWISPENFIPLAEDSGMIIEIGDWVFREAVQQIKQIRTTIDPNFQISINKSPIQFHNDVFFFQQWVPLLKKLDLPGDSLVIEITEGLLLNMSESVIAKLFALRDAGIQVAIDDFGTGYSSLSYLRKLDIDYLKIDQSFVHNLSGNSDNLILCEAIITMANKLGLKVIAEGVETETQNELLTSINCDYGQGFFFSRPVAASELNELVSKSIKQ